MLLRFELAPRGKYNFYKISGFSREFILQAADFAVFLYKAPFCPAETSRSRSGRSNICGGKSPSSKLLVQKERSLHVQILRHLREIEARQLYFSEGYASLFDYAVRGLGYSKGAAFRRIKAMRLCRDEPETLEKIKSGRLSLCAASQLQSFFEKQKKRLSV